MESHNPIIRPILKSDIVAYRGSVFEQSFRGIAVELDDKVIGVAGVLHTDTLQAFSMIKDELRKYPKTLVKAGRYFREILAKYESPIYAIASPDEENSEGFLEHVGFKQYNGRLYRWPIQ